MKEPPADQDASPSQRIDARIKELGGWRGKMLARLRAVITSADPGVDETWKWGVPVWEQRGIICTGEAYKAVVKLTFARGAALPDPSRLFNASLEGNTRRAIDFREGEKIDAKALKILVRAAVAHNALGKPASRGTAAKAASTGMAGKPGEPARASNRISNRAGNRTGGATATSRKGVVLLAGGNPQIAKGDGDAPVKAYLAALPGWKREVARRLDALIVRSVPGLQKAVKWNSPFYGVEGDGYFLGVHVFNRYLKVAFFRGAELTPPPPGASKDANVRYLDLHPGELDERQMTAWVKQAAALPGWRPARAAQRR